MPIPTQETAERITPLMQDDDPSGDLFDCTRNFEYTFFEFGTSRNSKLTITVPLWLLSPQRRY